MLNPLDIEEEKALIARAKAGDNEAAEVLLSIYQPAMIAASNRNDSYLSKNERDSTAQAAFVESLHIFDSARHQRLAAVIKNTLRHEYEYEKSTREVLSVPGRTISRYHHIMSKAGDDIFKALELAPKNDMSASTFLQVHHVLKDSAYIEEFDTESLVTSPITKAPQEAPEVVREQVKTIFKSLGDDSDLTPSEVKVLSTHYGLAGNNNSEQKSFAETAYELDMPIKEAKIHHINAIRKARKRLCNSNQ